MEKADDDAFIELGTREVWGGRAPFGLSPADRRQHLYLVGKSGSGKSTLLKHIIAQDLAAGRGLCVIDPHGDMAMELLDHVPSWRTDDVVYFDPADADHPIGLNLLAAVPPDQRHLVVSGVVGALKSVWGQSWGPRLEYILSMTLAALLECQNVSLLGVQRMLVEDRYRDWVVRQVADPVVRQFWTGEFDAWDARFRAEATSSIQNKVGQLLMGPLQNILGQVRSKVDARFMMDDRRVLIANLSKGRLGSDKSNLLGAILITQFQLAAMGRADVSESQRIDFGLFVDEFHNFTTDSFSSLLSEIRKYGIAVALGHQYVAQVPVDVRNAVFGNVGSLVSFRVGEADAAVLAREFGGGFSLNHFTDLENFEICVKLLDGGVQRDPFLGRTVPPSGVCYGLGDNVRRRSREKYGIPRAVVEDRIRRWMNH